MTKQDLIGDLSYYNSYNEIENNHLEEIISFVKSNDDLFSRLNQKGHITASAIVIDSEYENILLIWHNKLKRWLQPGGHIEPEKDDKISDAARRELIEETKLVQDQFELMSDTPFDLDVHLIPARKNDPEHFHYDIRYLFKYNGKKDASSEYKWVLVSNIINYNESSLNRFAQKIDSIR